MRAFIKYAVIVVGLAGLIIAAESYAQKDVLPTACWQPNEIEKDLRARIKMLQEGYMRCKHSTIVDGYCKAKVSDAVALYDSLKETETSSEYWRATEEVDAGCGTKLTEGTRLLIEVLRSLIALKPVPASS